MTYLHGLRVVTTALNLPGPAACARLRDLGASVVKVEPPTGDPFEGFCAPWYHELHARIEVRRIDLKTDAGRGEFSTLLESGDLLVTAQRTSALARLGIDPAALASRYARLCHVAITGHAAPDEETPGHDLTYMAAHGLVSPPAMPPTLYADMAGAERVVSTALALVIARDREGRGRSVAAPLADAAAFLAQPRVNGLTRPGALLGGGYPGYNLYAAKDGWIAVAALEPRFATRLAQDLEIPTLTAEALARAFAREASLHWEHWARERDLPIVAIRPSTQESP